MNKNDFKSEHDIFYKYRLSADFVKVDDDGPMTVFELVYKMGIFTIDNNVYYRYMTYVDINIMAEAVVDIDQMRDIVKTNSNSKFKNGNVILDE
jgi:hypothetical protein